MSEPTTHEVEWTWQGEQVRLGLTPEYVQQALKDAQIVADLRRVGEKLQEAGLELSMYETATDWAGLGIPTKQITATLKALNGIRDAVYARRAQLGQAVQMRDFVLRRYVEDAQAKADFAKWQEEAAEHQAAENAAS